MASVHEEWKSLPGKRAWMPYEVSNFGRIRRSITHPLPDNPGRIVPGKVMVLKIDGLGYAAVDLSTGSKPRKITLRVHRLVAEAFLPRVPGKNVVNHKDGNKANPHADNLEWCTPKENAIHAFSIGVGGKRKGPDIPQERRVAIASMRLAGHSVGDVARIFSVSQTTVWKITKERSQKF